jgi:hypothetical protein
MPKTKTEIPQILMKHPTRGYKYFDKQMEAYALRRDWMIAFPAEVAAFEAREAPVVESEEDRLRKEIEALKKQLNGKTIATVEIDKPVVTLVPSEHTAEENQPELKKRGRPKKEL